MAKGEHAMVMSEVTLVELEKALVPVREHLERIKQHLFCKSRFSEAGHLASMFR
jgi:hypothetical protein